MRCAIYTRKSTSEGLEQDFNTLDAQRESCVNYIASQKHEGWIALAAEYNDGGFTGANIDRPALQRLIADIAVQKIDCIVVYKVDRLSRSLVDFAKLLEYFEKYKVTFVSVTQHFNTNNSMGRLTLNILLSFAQFEREIISERTKDKMSAARQKGKWLGGFPVLGYDIDSNNKCLVINKTEAPLVKQIFSLYLAHCSAMEVANILNASKHQTKIHKAKNDKIFGGKPYRKSDIARIIANYLYIGKIKYQGKIFDGQQPAIVSEEVFYQAQKLKAKNWRRRDNLKTVANTSLLRHLLWCKSCNAKMIPTYTAKNKQKYRYYVCSNAQKTGFNNCPTRSVSANEIESAVIDCVKKIIAENNLTQANIINSTLWETLFPQEQRRILNLIIDKIYYDSQSNYLTITLNQQGLEELAHEF